MKQPRQGFLESITIYIHSLTPDSSIPMPSPHHPHPLIRRQTQHHRRPYRLLEWHRVLVVVAFPVGGVEIAQLLPMKITLEGGLEMRARGGDRAEEVADMSLLEWVRPPSKMNSR